MKVTIDGNVYEYDRDAMTLEEAFELKDQTGWGLRDFALALNDREPAAIAMIAYLIRKRSGERVDWRKSVVDISSFMDSLTTAEESPDPT